MDRIVLNVQNSIVNSQFVRKKYLFIFQTFSFRGILFLISFSFLDIFRSQNIYNKISIKFKDFILFFTLDLFQKQNTHQYRCVINTHKNVKYSFKFQSECKLGLLFCSTKTGMYHRDLGANITKGDLGKIISFFNFQKNTICNHRN